MKWVCLFKCFLHFTLVYQAHYYNFSSYVGINLCPKTSEYMSLYCSHIYHYMSITANVKNQPQPYEAESIVVNVAGRLLMFQRDRSGLQPKPRDSPTKERPVSVMLHVLVLLQK